MDSRGTAAAADIWCCCCCQLHACTLRMRQQLGCGEMDDGPHSAAEGRRAHICCFCGFPCLWLVVVVVELVAPETFITGEAIERREASSSSEQHTANNTQRDERRRSRELLRQTRSHSLWQRRSSCVLIGNDNETTTTSAGSLELGASFELWLLLRTVRAAAFELRL